MKNSTIAVMIGAIAAIGIIVYFVYTYFQPQPSPSPGPGSGQQSYTVTFSESGLPASSPNWVLNIEQTGQTGMQTYNSDGNGQVIITLPQGTYTAYYSTNVYAYEPVNDKSSITVNSNKNIIVAFKPMTLKTYPVKFTELGLPSGSSWGITINGITKNTTDSSITLDLPTGNYGWDINAPPGYQSSSNNRDVTVYSYPVDIAVSFTPTPKPSVVFNEDGLANGVKWQIFTNNNTYSSTNSTITIHNLSNRTYNYKVLAPSGYAATPSSGSYNPARTNYIPITFTLIQSSVSIKESGLPYGSSWEIKIGNTVYQSATNTISINLMYGTYNYSVPDQNVNGITYKPSPSSGTFTVGSSGYSFSVSFSKESTPGPEYTVTVSENGLSSGLRWAFYVGTKAYTATSPNQISFQLPAGTYSYSVGNVNVSEHYYYSPQPSSGTFTITSTSSNIITITFTGHYVEGR